MSLDCMVLVTKSLSLLAGLGDGKGGAVTGSWTCCARKCTNWKGHVAGSGSERACRLSDWLL